MTHAPETTAPETSARKLASVSGAGFSRQLQNFWRQKPTRTKKSNQTFYLAIRPTHVGLNK